MAWIACDPDSELMRRAGEDLCVPVKMTRAFDWWTSHALRRFCRIHQIDVVHTHSSKDSWLCYPLHVAAWPVVRSRQITNPVRPSMDRSFIYRRGCAAVFASAECIRKELVSHTGVAAERVHVVGEGTDTDQFHPSVDGRALRAEWGVSEDAVLFGVVAMIRPEKGHGVFLSAVEELMKTHGGEERVRFAIVGEGVGDRAFEYEIRKRLIDAFGSACGGPVFMTGYRQDVSRVMAALDVLVVPSLAEAQSIVVPQAFATGKPVIASRVGGLPEVVEHEQTGLLVNPGDAAALAGAMARMADDVVFRTEAGKRGREFAQGRLSFSAKMEESLSLYAKIMAERTGARSVRRRGDHRRVQGNILGERPRRRTRRWAAVLAPVSALAVVAALFFGTGAPVNDVAPIEGKMFEHLHTSGGTAKDAASVDGRERDDSNLDESLSPSMFAASDERIIG
jgi:glycosyltransferase involved in cell wall biosynthesis